MRKCTSDYCQAAYSGANREQLRLKNPSGAQRKSCASASMINQNLEWWPFLENAASIWMDAAFFVLTAKQHAC